VVNGKLLRRSRQRGASLVVVVLVVTLLMGIGGFAARSAAVATAASGSERQMAQSRYVAEYGIQFAAAKLSNGGAQAYLQAMRRPQSGDVCYGQDPLNPTRTCYRVLEVDVQNDLTNAGALRVYDPAPGSFGNAPVEADFNVELSDLSEGFTMPGFDLGPGKALKFWYVTATSTGQVRLINTTPGSLDARSGESSATQVVRSRILVGPFPSN
jgi:hypothetical protein